MERLVISLVLATLIVKGFLIEKVELAKRKSEFAKRRLEKWRKKWK